MRQFFKVITIWGVGFISCVTAIVISNLFFLKNAFSTTETLGISLTLATIGSIMSLSQRKIQ